MRLFVLAISFFFTATALGQHYQETGYDGAATTDSETDFFGIIVGGGRSARATHDDAPDAAIATAHIGPTPAPFSSLLGSVTKVATVNDASGYSISHQDGKVKGAGDSVRVLLSIKCDELPTPPMNADASGWVKVTKNHGVLLGMDWELIELDTPFGDFCIVFVETSDGSTAAITKTKKQVVMDVTFPAATNSLIRTQGESTGRTGTGHGFRVEALSSAKVLDTIF